jgi:hypothetical protein
MWQCSKCEAVQTDPKANHDHIQKCQAKPRARVLGWQGLKLDGVPRSKKTGLLLSEMYEAWKNIQPPQDDAK